ncbi:MAG: FliH/SctL family protein [Candidatus Binatia bacterium]
MSRRLARDHLHVDDVRPYEPAGRLPNEERVVETLEFASGRDIELEFLDLVKLGPYLLLLSARESAEALVGDAQSEAEKIREQSRSQGAAQGREEAKEDVLPAAVAFANAGQALIVFEEQMIARYAAEMVRLALKIAEKIVHRTVSAEPEIVASVLQRARQEVTDARQIRIRLHPADYELLAELRPDLLTSGNESGRAIEVVTDGDMSRGGCRLETEIGVVDATLPTQIAEIRRQLLDQESLTNHADSMPRTTLTAGMSREL